MDKTGQTVGQSRDAGNPESQQVERAYTQLQRRPDERAVLVSERSARWDRRLAPLPDVVEPTFDVGSLGPLPTEWTGSLVHCRLVTVDAMMRRLPRVKVPSVYRSFLGAMQPQDASPARRAVMPDEIARLDWTWDRVCCFPETDRAVLMGLMSGKSLRTVAKVTTRLAALGVGSELKKDAVAGRYRALTKLMALEWNVLREYIDAATRECWLAVSSKKQ